MVAECLLGATGAWLEIGPRDEIGQEIERFERFVRYGVRLVNRVELLGAATANSLAVIVYSFAGVSSVMRLWRSTACSSMRIPLAWRLSIGSSTWIIRTGIT